MNQVIFANQISNDTPLGVQFIPTSLVNMSPADAAEEGTITDYPNEDFIIHHMTPSKTVKTIEVNRETLNIQKVNLFDFGNGGEYGYELAELPDNANDGDAVQIIRQNAVPHQRNSWYIELSGNRDNSFWNQLKVLSKSELLGITVVNHNDGFIVSKYPLTFKFIGFDFADENIVRYITKNPHQYLQMLLTKHVQNFGYNHTDDNAELNSGLADYKAWITGTEYDSTVAVYRLRFATNRKASKTRDECVWQNVYICCKGENNGVAALLDDYIAILNGEETEGGE